MAQRALAVAAIDFSKGSIDAAKWAAGWLLRDSDLVLAHALVIPEVRGILADRYPVSESLLANARAGARRRLEQVRSMLGVPAARIEIREGRPADAIGAIARDAHADLIIIGKHGEGGWHRGYAGRTADSLVRSAPATVLVVNGAPTKPPKRIVVPLTYSSIVNDIAKWAQHAQASSGARITVIHVIGSAVLSHVLSMRAVQTGDAPSGVELEKIFSEDRDRWSKLLVETGIPVSHVESEVLFGEVSTAVLGASSDLGADMIVMGSHAGPIRRALLGSAASAVLRESDIPVMVVVEREHSAEREDNPVLASSGASYYEI